MKHRLFGKLALSAALLGTAALPVHASGADTPSNAPSQTGKSTPIKTIAAFNSVPDPLELAKKYAPETVQDWKDTLEKYGKLAVTEGTFYFSEAATTVELSGDVKPDDVKGVVSIAVRATPAKDIQELIDSGEIKEFNTTMIKEGVAPLEDVTLFEAGEAVKMDAAEVPSGLIQADEVSIQAVKISDEDLAFAHARIDLFKAVDSKESAAIKDALAKLLDQYKEQITKLEAAAK